MKVQFPLLAAAFLAFAIASPAIHAAPPAPVKTQVPGFYRASVGDFEITALFDGHTRIAQQLLHGLGNGDIQSQLRQAFVAPEAPIQTAVNAYLVHTGKHLVLVDTGAAACFGPTLGNVLNSVRSAGYRPGDIDTVLITHLHGDHACGLADKGAAAFPNATVWVAKDEADYWLGEKTAAQAPENSRGAFKLARDSVAPYAASGRLKTHAPGDALLPGVSAAPSPGHTPGHSGYLFSSKGQKLLVWGDIVHSHAVQFQHPKVSIEFDSDQAQAIATREKVFAEAAETGVLVAGMHLPFPGLGHVVREKQGYRWVPVEFGQNFVEPK
ncbi:MAG: MBL fold metallo-hydrolase [Azoarcus sp.]|jgi:glyoxylase-like metal-dependent hydrolase (beta-lactamase superfamily II)|nr:MBL fold metallo-hydrolase [Azoarcus sp.]